MADLSDVSNALGALIGNALYPSGASGENPSPVAGVPVRVDVGWPSPQTLDAAMSAGKAHVSIYPRPNERNTTRYPQTWDQSGALQTKTFTFTQAGQVVTVGGIQPSPIFYGHNFAAFVNGVAYIYRSLESDGVDSIAAALCALIASDVPGTTVSGAAITLPNAARIGPLRVGTQAPVLMELKRQEREYQMIVWAGTPAIRDAVAKPIDVLIPQTKFLTLADGTSARLIYKGSPFNDFDQKQGIYRRDFIVSAEYATTAADIAPEVIAVKTVTSQKGADGSIITPPINTTYN